MIMSKLSRLHPLLLLLLMMLFIAGSINAQDVELEEVDQEILIDINIDIDSMYSAQEYLEEAPMRQLDSAEWKKLSDEIDYSKDKIPAKQEIKDIKPPTGPSWNFGTDWVKYVLFGLAAIFLFFILFRGFFKGKNEEEPEEEEVDVRVLSEEKLLELNLEELLQRALQDADYKMAFRLHYLLLIKILKERRYIRWQKEKTNHDYLMELRNTFAFSPFRKITAMYDMIWYGDRPVNKDIYNYFSSEMDTLSADLRNGKSSDTNHLTDVKEGGDVE
jgi:hypothetical protein